MASQPRESEVQAKAAKAKELRNTLVRGIAKAISYSEIKGFPLPSLEEVLKAFPPPSLEEIRNTMSDNWRSQLRTDEDQQRFLEPFFKKYLKNMGTAGRAKGGLIKKSKVKKKSKKKAPAKKRRTRRKKKA